MRCADGCDEDGIIVDVCSAEGGNDNADGGVDNCDGVADNADGAVGVSDGLAAVGSGSCKRSCMGASGVSCCKMG
jgi:hypothetical protein